VSYGALGTTHHSLHDLAALRAVNNIDIVVPADNVETREAIRLAARRTTPIYLRFGKAPLYNLHQPNLRSEISNLEFEIGRSIQLQDGVDIAFIATGETVIHALLAAEKLKTEQHLSCRVISMHTIKPLDTDAVLRAARECRAIVTVEEHFVHGGLGEACAATLMQAGARLPFRIIGIPDEYTVTGSQADIFRHYGISMEGLTQTAQSLIAASSP
jgi:transketolase